MKSTENYRWIDVARIVAGALIYVLGAWVGQYFSDSYSIPLIWPPTGFALAWLLVYGYRVWPGVAIGALISQLGAGATMPIAGGFAVANTLEVLFASWLLNQAKFDHALERPRDVVLLGLLGAGLSPWISSSLGTATLVIGGSMTMDHALEASLNAWMGGALSDLLFVPLVLAFYQRRNSSGLNPLRLLEIVLFSLLLLLSCAMIFFDWRPGAADYHPRVFMLFPFAIWAALRFRLRGVGFTTMAITVFGLWSMVKGTGYFGRVEASGQLFFWSFMTVWSVTALIVSATYSGRIRTESVLKRTEAEYRELVESVQAVIWRARKPGEFTYVSREAELLLGYPLSEWTSSPAFWAEHVHPDDREWVISYSNSEVAQLVGYDIEYRMQAAGGRIVWLHDSVRVIPDETGEYSQLVGIMLDITKRKQSEAQLHYLANHDSLTGLANRNLLQERIEHALRLAPRNSKAVAILFIDLDRFKVINDTLGHHTGDKLLQEAATRLKTCLRDTDTIARQGGDEFVVLVEQLSDPQYLSGMANKILQQICQPFLLMGQEYHVTASIGISVYPDDGDDMHTLLKHADVAMYRAKEQGRNTFQFYAAENNVHSVERLELENSLRHALERNEFLLYYQPKVDARTGQTVGAEALLRWNRPGYGLVSPALFIPLAEETGLIIPIGAWVLQEVCRQAREWQVAGLPLIRVAVNLSARQFHDESLPDTIAHALAASGLTPSFLELEITESMVMQRADQAILLLQRFHDMGTHVSIDDFGTGYSSLGYLKQFPIDALKIDRSFINDVPNDADDMAITQAIISMAHNLGVHVVAEGVENTAQLEFLQRHGCDQIQGFLFSKPLSVENFSEFLKSGADASIIG